MNVRANPRYELFHTELNRLRRRFSKWQGVAFRATPLEFSRLEKLLDGKGSLRAGGRWSAAGTFRAVNLSTTQEVAVKEGSANFTYYNFALSDVRPRLLVGVRFKLGRVIDLTRADGVQSLKSIHLTELLAEDWRKVNDSGHESQSQALGRAVHDIGAEGLLAPSVRVPGGVNLVYFPESVLGKGKVEILGEAELERWLKKR